MNKKHIHQRLKPSDFSPFLLFSQKIAPEIRAAAVTGVYCPQTFYIYN